MERILIWRKARPGAGSLEVASMGEEVGVALRNSAFPAAGVITASWVEWAEFQMGVMRGDFEPGNLPEPKEVAEPWLG